MDHLPALPASAVGFTGSRRLSPVWAPLVASLVDAVIATDRLVAVGCASGADAMVRAAAPAAVVFHAELDLGRAAFPARSAALVRAVAASGPDAAFAAFVSAPCPEGIRPAASWSSGAQPSGSWSTVALAAGLCLPLAVFWCAPGDELLPAWPPWSWQPAYLVPGGRAFVLVPPATQPALF